MNIESSQERPDSGGSEPTTPLDDSAVQMNVLRMWSSRTTIQFGGTPSASPAPDCSGHDHTTLCPPVEPMFAEAADPSISFVRLQQIHTKIMELGCPACAGAFQMEMKIRSVLAVCACDDAAPDHLSGRIVEQLATIDLSEVDVSDIDF